MDPSTRHAFRLLADGLWKVEMTLQLHLNSLQALSPGPIDKHQLSRLLRDLEKHIAQLHSTASQIAAGPTTAGPDDKTRVRSDLT